MDELKFFIKKQRENFNACFFAVFFSFRGGSVCSVEGRELWGKTTTAVGRDLTKYFCCKVTMGQWGAR